MNEALTFILNLREFVSGGMAKIASTAHSVFPGVDKLVGTTEKKVMEVAAIVARVPVALKVVGAAANTNFGILAARANESAFAFARMQNSLRIVGSTGTGAMRQVATGVEEVTRKAEAAAVAVKKVETAVVRTNRAAGGGSQGKAGGGMHVPWWLSGAVIGGLAIGGIAGMIKTGADQQRDVVGLSTFMGKEKAQGFYNSVQQDARITPFVTHDLMAADRMLISTGMNADRARGDIMNLANAVAATGGSNYALERMAQHLQMIRNMGHASYLQLKEFTTNGINIMQLLSDATGKNVKMAHGMTVSYAAIEKALAHAAGAGGLFYNALYAQSQTIWGKWSTLVDDLQLSAGKIVTSQSGAITGLLDLFDKYAQRLPEMAQQWGGAITNITTHLLGLVSMLIDLGKWLYHNWTWLKYVVGVFVAFKVAIWAASTTMVIYNTVMSLAAIRATALAVAEGEAAAGAVALDVAMAATPWGLIALGITGVGLAITALVSQSKNAGTEINKNLTPAADKVFKGDRGTPTMDDVAMGTAYGPGSMGGKISWKPKDIMDAPLTAAEQAKLADARRRWYAGESRNSNLAESNVMDQIRKDRETEAARIQALMVIRMPAKSAAKVPKEAPEDAPDSGGGVDSGAIVGGGGKRVIINFRNFTEHFSVNVKDTAEALGVTEEKFEEMFMRLLYSAKAAI